MEECYRVSVLGVISLNDFLPLLFGQLLKASVSFNPLVFGQFKVNYLRFQLNSNGEMG